MTANRLVAGILCRVLATVFFAGVMALAQIAISAGGFSMTYFLRGVCAIPVIVVFMMVRGAFPSAVLTARPWDHLLRGLLAAASLACTFAAISRLPVSLAAALSFLAPVFVTVGAGLMLRERVAWRTWFALGLSCVGVALASRSELSTFAGSNSNLTGLLYGLAGAALMAMSMLQLKRLSATESAATLAFYFSAAIAIIGLCSFAFVGSQAVQVVTLAAVLAGVSGGLGQLFLAESMRLAPASRLAPFDYLLLVWAALWDLVVMPHALQTEMLAAVLLIGLSALIMMLPAAPRTTARR